MRVEINTRETERESYFVLFYRLLQTYRNLGFSISADKSSTNQSEYPNIIEFNLEPTINIGELVTDLEEDLLKNFESVHNTVRIKKELRK